MRFSRGAHLVDLVAMMAVADGVLSKEKALA